MPFEIAVPIIFLTQLTIDTCKVILKCPPINHLVMRLSIDDVGSFPLPSNTTRKLFDKAYQLAREATLNGREVKKDRFLLNNFYKIVVDSFLKKARTGLDVINYPQHYDMHKQFTDVIKRSMNEGTYLVQNNYATLPEIHVLNEGAKRISEEVGKKVSLRVSITGPIELYLRMIGTTIYRDVLLIFAENVRRFARNSILNAKHIETAVISLDEPSIGFQDISLNKETFLNVLERAFDFGNVKKQIHLHSPSGTVQLMNIKAIDVLSVEYAASPKNIDSISKKMLIQADKQIRVGISRTDIDSIIAEFFDAGTTKPTDSQIVESESTIRKRFEKAKAKYEDTMTFAGPDCGLGGWPSQETAELLLKRTVNAVRKV